MIEWMEAARVDRGDFTQAMEDYCLEELKYKADIYKKTGIITLFHGDVVKSDATISPELQEALKTAAVPLENIPDHKKFGPGSRHLVHNPVDPSLYPLVYGVSRIVTGEKLDLMTGISMSGAGDTVPVPSINEAGPIYYPIHTLEPSALAFSRNFQWLPCEVDVSGETPR